MRTRLSPMPFKNELVFPSDRVSTFWSRWFEELRAWINTTFDDEVTFAATTINNGYTEYSISLPGARVGDAVIAAATFPAGVYITGATIVTDDNISLLIYNNGANVAVPDTNVRVTLVS